MEEEVHSTYIDFSSLHKTVYFEIFLAGFNEHRIVVEIWNIKVWWSRFGDNLWLYKQESVPGALSTIGLTPSNVFTCCKEIISRELSQGALRLICFIPRMFLFHYPLVSYSLIIH